MIVFAGLLALGSIGGGLFVMRALVRRGQRKAAFVSSQLLQVQMGMHRQEVLRVSPARDTIALGELSRDYTLSPYTGLTRESWRSVGYWLLANMLQYTDGMTGPPRFPPSSAARVPTVGPSGAVEGTQEVQLETFARSLLLASFVLVDQPDLEMHGRSLKDYYAEMLQRGVSPNDEMFFGVGSSDRPSQTVVEAASVAIALMLAEDVLWKPLDRSDRRRIIRWFESVRHNPVVDNNWRWFGILIEAFLEYAGGTPDERVLVEHFEAIESFHSGGGWFRDRSRFDYYSGWAFHFYPLVWMRMNTSDPTGFKKSFLARNDAFLQSFVHLFSRRGEMPLWGRSICYRNAASAPFAASFLRDEPPSFDPGFARMLCSGNLLQFLVNPRFLRAGLVPLGFHGEQPDLIDSYSSVGSPYWCVKPFICLTLPPTHPFWTATESDGFWSDPPSRVDIAETGMWVEHDRDTGNSRLFAPHNGPSDDPRYSRAFFDTGDAVYRGKRRSGFE